MMEMTQQKDHFKAEKFTLTDKVVKTQNEHCSLK